MNLYADLDAFTLGELLGIDFDDVEGRTHWGYKRDFKDCCDKFKVANNRELLEPLVSEERYAELEAQAEEIDNGTRSEDLDLTEEERSALADAYGEAHVSSEGVATAIETLCSSTGIALDFEVVFGPDGPEQAYSPYELRSGGGFDTSGYAALE
jgi:hypothetical protein